MSEATTEIKEDVTTDADGGDVTTETATEKRGAADSVLSGGEGDDTEIKKDAQGHWPDDWREKLAGEDDKFLKQLKRLSSPEGLAKKTRSLEQKLSSGEYKRVLPEGATDEQVAEWRKEVGIPDKPDGYEMPKISGFEWSDDDKAIAKTYFEKVHGKNASPEVVSASMEWYAELQQQTEAKVYEADVKNKEETEDALRAEWGGEYRGNLALVKRFIDNDLPHGEEVAYARLPDGRRLIETPEFVKWISDNARATYGDGGILTGEGASAMANRKEEIQKIMRTDLPKYYEDGLDKEYSKILEREHASQKQSA